MADDPKVLQAANLVKLGMARELKECLAACSPEAVNKRDDQGSDNDWGFVRHRFMSNCKVSLGARFRSQGRLAFRCALLRSARAVMNVHGPLCRVQRLCMLALAGCAHRPFDFWNVGGLLPS